ncbi:CDP-alcohol phosphatidyltransferase family protein [uncultured Brevundimonas sp.]|uniref:CDP-alcohol phosphatidyltransferase family protein n=1 Tax=uncultured Brevundimonas sp. TaxID=213418 RepID=UPI0030EBEED1|tara:strand:+ start:11023 stop:11607 length:585 start_codon:yes stop_codon:yes gene_type:complete
MSGRALSRLLDEGGGLKLANLVTLSRGVLIVPILGLLLTGHPVWALGLYVIAALTDAVDGWLARRSGQASTFGAQLDAAVDNVFSLAILVFLMLAFPGLSERQALALIALAVVPPAYLAVSWLLTRRVLMFHFWSAKAGALLLFVLWPVMAITGQEVWLPLAAVLTTLSRLEQLVFIARGGRALDQPHGFAPVV